MKAKTIVGGVAAALLMVAPVIAQTTQNAGTDTTKTDTTKAGKSDPNERMPAQPAVPPATSGSSEASKGSKVSPLPAPDSTTIQGQERGTSAGSSSSPDDTHTPNTGGTAK